MKKTKNVEIKNTEEYLRKFKSENTKAAAMTLIKKLGRYINDDLNNIKDIKKYEIDMFIKKEMEGKSETTISNTVSRLKDLCSFYGNESAQHLNLNYVKEITQAKKSVYLSPYEIYRVIENLINWQDKALLLLAYIGLYDNDFKTIKSLRVDQFKGDRIELDDGRVIELNEYCSNIISNAIKEESAYKYMFITDRIEEAVYDLKITPYIIRTGDRTHSESEMVSTSALIKKFKVFGKATDVENLSVTMIKNSEFLYRLVKLEVETNFGLDINQVELSNYCKENNLRGSIGKLNLSKKEMKYKIMSEILSGKDIIHQ